ncbi:UNVERIFIED_CONTAM: hypothetical protein Sradi_4420700 [Sesamum radiatum]|uniref:GAG-pre-integrase domain-containing protein n=1 Tax=Sesamum radiatum TaxID=300843 RepID=A0AAW2NTH7_SESRA
MDNHENAQIWHARLGHISKDRIRRLVDSKNLEIDNLDHLPTCESCLKGNDQEALCWTKRDSQRFIGLGPYRCFGPLSIPTRGGFSYFITFTDDRSLYGYVYLMRYKSEAFGRFKEYRLEVENQTSRKIKALRSDRGGKYLSGEFKRSRLLLGDLIGYPKVTNRYYFMIRSRAKDLCLEECSIFGKGFFIE